MSGIDDLQTLVEEMSPRLLRQSFCFIHKPLSRYGDFSVLRPIASFQEKEGLTLVIPHEAAIESGFAAAPVFSCLTLGVHSALTSVGLTAIVSSRLAEQGISVNVIAGYFHDHFFIPEADARRALAVLQSMAAG